MSSFEPTHFQEFQGGAPLNRSASFSDMSIRKRIIIEERLVPTPAGTSIFRQYSCEELRHSPAKSEVCILRQSVSEVHIPRDNNIKYPQIDFKPSAPLRNLAIEGDMKTKGSSESVFLKKPEGKKSQSFGLFKKSERKSQSNYFKEKKSNPSSKSAKMKETHETTSELCETKSTSRKGCCFYVSILVPFLCVCLFFVVDFIIHINCLVNVDINEMKAVMLSKMFGQAATVQDILSALEIFFNSRESGLTLLVLTGTTGVGKSYLVSLLEEQFPWKNNIHHFVMPIGPEDMRLRTHNLFPSCGDNLVVIDSLTKSDVSEAVQFIKSLSVIAENKRILALFVFSLSSSLSEEPSYNNLVAESSALSNKFQKAGVDINLIPFQTLKKEHVISCVEEALARSKYPYSKQRVDRILGELYPFHDGCKRVQSKVPLHVGIQNGDL